MKSVLATAIVSAALSAAQKYSTSIYTDCTPLPDKTITSYNTATITYCPECEGGPGGYKHTTVWTTKLYDFCPTGLSAYTVTITESCTNATPTWSPGHPNYIPQGYTTSEMTCTVCGDAPITRVMTYPMGSPPAYPPAGAGGAGAAPATTPAAVPGAGPCPGPECRLPNGTPTAGFPGSGSPDSQPPAAGGSGSGLSPYPGSSANSGSAQTPSPALPGSPEIPGPNRSPGSSIPGPIIPAPAGNGSTIPPSSGAVSTKRTGIYSLVTIAMGALFSVFTI